MLCFIFVFVMLSCPFFELFVFVSYSLVIACWKMAKTNDSLVVHFILVLSLSVPGQVWYIFTWIPVFCFLLYFAFFTEICTVYYRQGFFIIIFVINEISVANVLLYIENFSGD